MGMLEPRVGTSIQIEGENYAFDGVPGADEVVYAEPGRKAKVYRLLQGKGSEKKALKVFYREFRSSQADQALVENTQNLKKFFYSSYPSDAEKKNSALQVAERSVILPEKNNALIRNYSEFDYSLLMNWMDGDSWSNYVADKEPLSSDQSIVLASAFANSISGLESRNAAHCDLSGGNFVIKGFKNIELVDIEDLYSPDFPSPNPLPAGTGGYVPNFVHKNGLWGQYADRYAAALILSEILCWQFQDVRNVRHSMSYFAEGEPCHSETDRYKIMYSSLGKIEPGLATLFSKMWKSKEVDNCPSITEWKQVIDRLKPRDLECGRCKKLVQTDWKKCPYCGNWLTDDGGTIATPSLSYEPKDLNFGEVSFDDQGKSPSVVLSIWNEGKGTLIGNILTYVPWLRVSQSNFSVRAGQEHLRLYLTLQKDCPRPKPGQFFRFPIGIIIETNARESIAVGGSYKTQSSGIMSWFK